MCYYIRVDKKRGLCLKLIGKRSLLWLSEKEDRIMALNNVTLQGRLTKNVELRNTSTGKTWAVFTIAVQRSFKNSNGDYEADFPGIVVWGKTAEFVANHFTKGSAINIIGRIETESYDDKNGNRVYRTNVVATQVLFSDGNNGGRNNQAGNSNNSNNNYGRPNNGYNNGGYNNGQNNANTQRNYGGNTSAGKNNMVNNPSDQINISDDDLPF